MNKYLKIAFGVFGASMYVGGGFILSVYLGVFHPVFFFIGFSAVVAGGIAGLIYSLDKLVG